MQKSSTYIKNAEMVILKDRKQWAELFMGTNLPAIRYFVSDK